jgi:hypothetical protein
MGTILLHAGMGKTGSSSIQRWLDEHSTLLRTQREVHLLRARPRPDDPRRQHLQVVPHKPGKIHSSFVQGVFGYDPDAPADRQFFEELDLEASRHRTVLLAGEGFAALFWGANDANLAALNELASAHDIRVAYYVRPQHTSLEAAWRQWGFRSVQKPSGYIRFARRSRRYLQTLERVERVAPHVSFEMRPFRQDLMKGGDVVTDFTSVFLGMDDVLPAPSSQQWSNVGLPLDLVILLRHAPPGMFWSRQDKRKLNELRRLVSTWNVPESAAVHRSRLVLQHYCYREFERDNQQLMKRLGWRASYFVPPVENGAELDLGGLAELDQLWTADASEAERSLLFLALNQLLTS